MFGNEVGDIAFDLDPLPFVSFGHGLFGFDFPRLAPGPNSGNRDPDSIDKGRAKRRRGTWQLGDVFHRQPSPEFSKDRAGCIACIWTSIFVPRGEISSVDDRAFHPGTLPGDCYMP